MRKFIYKTYVNDDLNKEESIEVKKEFASRLALKFDHYLKKDEDLTIESLKGIDIENDPNINNTKKSDFIRNFGMLLRKELTGKNFNDALDSVLHFVYTVRNNIFHGTKTILEMMDPGQKVRLQTYTSILLSINDMLFEAIEKRFEWSKAQIDNDLNIERERRVRSIERRFYPRTVASRYRVSVPDGPLYYPCCGDDTYEPIMLFLDSISDFHFVDSRLIPKVAKMECKVKGYKENDSRRHNSRRTADKFTIPRELLASVTALAPCEDKIDAIKINNLKQRGIDYAGYTGQTGKIYKQEWQLVKDNRKITINRHVQDGLATFASLGQIAVFFLRRDSDGESGSRQRWFQESIFKFILDKLLDGGLIVTDGSGWDPILIDTAPWKSFWANRHEKFPNNVDKPQDFTYYNRQFRCLGYCGQGRGPVYVWQVIKF